MARQLTTFTGPDESPRPGEPPRLESRWALHRLPPGWSRFADLLRRAPARRDPLGRQRRSDVAHGLARSRGIAIRSGAPTARHSTSGSRTIAPGISPAFRRQADRSSRILDGRRVVSEYTRTREGRLAVLVDATDRPAEVYAVEGPGLRPLSRQNDSLMAGRRLAPVEEITVKSKDGTRSTGSWCARSPARDRGLPTILRSTAGRVSQFQNGVHVLLAAACRQGYAVVAMNPRGSSGRGEKYSLAIWADWGNRDAQDVLAGVDHAVRIGVADPDRLGVGGWSYGGILTNYVIAQDTRFKAATSGASISNILAGYGTDMYIREYRRSWARRGRTPRPGSGCRSPSCMPTGSGRRRCSSVARKDFNVPLLNSEQMYQALRQSRRAHQAGHLPRSVSTAIEAELSAPPLRAVPRVVRGVSQAIVPRCRWSAGAGRAARKPEGLPELGLGRPGPLAAAVGPRCGAAVRRLQMRRSTTVWGYRGQRGSYGAAGTMQMVPPPNALPS